MSSTTWHNLQSLKLCCRKPVRAQMSYMPPSLLVNPNMKHCVRSTDFTIYTPKQDTGRDVLAGWCLCSFLSPSSPTKLLIAQMKLPAILTKSDSEEFGTEWKLEVNSHLQSLTLELQRVGFFKSIILEQKLLSVVVTQSTPPYGPFYLQSPQKRARKDVLAVTSHNLKLLCAHT